MAVTRIADLAEYLAGRCRVYDEAFAADLRRLRAVHGAGTVMTHCAYSISTPINRTNTSRPCAKAWKGH